jgi:hypothetical protein
MAGWIAAPHRGSQDSQMRLTLASHPDTPCEAVHGIAVDVARAGAKLSLRYAIEGGLEQVALTPRGERARADELWKHTCFEAFVSAGRGYGEINLSPSNRWAAYGFDGYRSGMAQARGFELLRLDDRRTAQAYELAAELDLTDLPPESDWSVGLSAVIELTDGRRCFWALRHAPGAPDFHHPDAFALRLPAESP